MMLRTLSLPKEGVTVLEKKVFLRESQNTASVIELTGSPGIHGSDLEVKLSLATRQIS